MNSVHALKDLLGKKVTIFAVNYIYSGTLVEVTENAAKLADAGIVYETGPFNEKQWKDFQTFPDGEWYVSLQAIESFGVLK